MAKHIYQVVGEFDYSQEASSPGECRKFFDRILKEKDLKDKNFTISVSRIDGKKEKNPEVEIDSETGEEIQVVEKPTKKESKVRKIRKAKKKKKNSKSAYHFA